MKNQMIIEAPELSHKTEMLFNLFEEGATILDDEIVNYFITISGQDLISQLPQPILIRLVIIMRIETLAVLDSVLDDQIMQMVVFALIKNHASSHGGAVDSDSLTKAKGYIDQIRQLISDVILLTCENYPFTAYQLLKPQWGNKYVGSVTRTQINRLEEVH